MINPPSEIVPTESGVYQIKNKDNRKSYIGSTLSLSERRMCHIRNLNQGKHHSTHLQYSWNKYGAAVFEFIVLECVAIGHLIEREQFFMDMLLPEYNECPVAGSCKGRPAPNKGSKASAETRSRMSQSAKGRKQSPKNKAALIRSNKEREWTPEQRGKLRAANVGRPVSQETRKKISRASSGRKLSPEHKEKLLVASRGRVVSQETREKIRQSLLGQKPSAETLRKRSETRKVRRSK